MDQERENRDQTIAQVEAFKNGIQHRNIEDMVFIMEELKKITDDLRARYDDCENYKLFHVLVGSSEKSPSEKFDFPGKDSILEIIERIEQALKEHKKKVEN